VRPEVAFHPPPDVELVLGPVHIASQNEICWTIRPRKAAEYTLRFDVAGQSMSKELAVGDGFLRVSVLRPNQNWLSILEHPGEPPLPADGPLEEIAIQYPDRTGWISGSESWFIYWFVASLIAGWCLRPVFDVKL
jgi:hypothetical protein